MKGSIFFAIVMLIFCVFAGILAFHREDNSTQVIIKSPKINCQKYQDGTISCTIKVDGK